MLNMKSFKKLGMISPRKSLVYYNKGRLGIIDVTKHVKSFLFHPVRGIDFSGFRCMTKLGATDKCPTVEILRQC